ncbi:MAG TPA: 7-cyano-7-deazaguanine synthase QueC [Acidobacteriota bacterium]|nr:7-cyano-7-deazaguanine synthase QueC [Acidobacteriota bacterium]
MAKAVCLVSGGLDSCVSAAVAANNGMELAFLHLSYGQLTEKRERRAFEEIADFYKVDQRLAADLSHLAVIGGSALTDRKIELPRDRLDAEGIPVSYVPFRNACMLSVAVGWAEVIGAHAVYIGAVEEDSSGYPDCRESFFRAFNVAVREGTRPESQIELVTPLIHLRKKAIVKRAVQLNAPIHLTWSCYLNEEKACGHCESCLLRLRGFEQAGAEDPIPYQD